VVVVDDAQLSDSTVMLHTLETVSGRSSFWWEKMLFSFCTSGCSRVLSGSLPLSSTATSSMINPRRSSTVLSFTLASSLSGHGLSFKCYHCTTEKITTATVSMSCTQSAHAPAQQQHTLIPVHKLQRLVAELHVISRPLVEGLQMWWVKSGALAAVYAPTSVLMTVTLRCDPCNGLDDMFSRVALM
jgi:hypothetical protein